MFCLVEQKTYFMMVNIWLVYEFPWPVKISEALLLSDSSARLWTGTQFTVMTCDVKPILLSVVVQAETFAFGSKFTT